MELLVLGEVEDGAGHLQNHVAGLEVERIRVVHLMGGKEWVRDGVGWYTV